MRVLIIDDSRTMRHYLAAMVRDLKCDSEQAADGQDALERLEGCDSDFDLALVDWDMPRIDGISFVKTVRSEPRFDAMKVMMLTAHSTMDSVCEALTAGADDYLMKPVTADMLSEKLNLLGLLD
jgi:two-component system chemotaxis response regulator CheY